jgi:hypothetical protein
VSWVTPEFDPDGWMFYFPVEQPNVEYRQAYQELWKKWLEQWQPAAEWMQ